MSHIKNRDILFMTLAGILLGSIVLIADFFLRSLWWGGGRRRRRSSRGGGGAQLIFALVAILLAILAPIIARLLYLACSRRREYLADASAAAMTRYPEGLASALEKISGDREVLEVANRATAPMYIVHPIKSFEKRAASLMSTHPPTEERIAILRAMGKTASYADYERAYAARHRGGHVVPPSAIAGDTPAPVRAPTEKPTAQQTPVERLRRTHEALDTVRKVQGFLFLVCACGARLKIPPTYTRPQVRCPRCGAGLRLRRPPEDPADLHPPPGPLPPLRRGPRPLRGPARRGGLSTHATHGRAPWDAPREHTGDMAWGPPHTQRDRTAWARGGMTGASNISAK